MTYPIEIVANTNDSCGEAPTWDGANRRVLWTDNESDKTYQLNVDSGEVKPLTEGLMVCGIALNKPGGLIFCGFGGLHVWRGPGDYRTVVSEHEGETLQFNDMIADPSGRIYAGTLYWGENGKEKDGKLYLITPDGSIEVMDEGIELSNGLGFSPDNKTLYYSDSSVRRIYAYDVDAASGALSNKRVLIQVPTNEGIPDGMTVDAEGFIWSAQWYGGQVVRYSPDGDVERRIDMPVKQVSSVIFGGDDLSDLYVTSAGNPAPSDFAPPSFDADNDDIGGPLFRVQPNVKGKPEFMADFPLS